MRALLPWLSLARDLREISRLPGSKFSALGGLDEFSLAGLLGRCYEPGKVPLARVPTSFIERHNTKAQKTCR